MSDESDAPTTDNLVPGRLVELRSGSPPMTVAQVTTPSRDAGTDVVAWWRAEDGRPQVAKFDARCLRSVPLSRRTQHRPRSRRST